jgi:DNA-binding LytR/AlgR family response regulator
VDKKTFFYTKQEIYETELKLYELEEQLAALDFIRANKSCVLNFNQVVSIKPDIDGKLLITMSNDEKLFVSRQYAPFIKKKLGVK